MLMQTELVKTKKQHMKTATQLIKTKKQDMKTTTQLIKTFFGLHGRQWHSIQRWKSS